MNIKIIILVSLSCLNLSFGDYAKPGPSIRPTIGEVWPKPKSFNRKDEQYFIIDPDNFRFQASIHNCDILEQAIARYSKIIIDSIKNIFITKLNSTTQPKAISIVKVELLSPCEKYPHEAMDESYEISVEQGKIKGNAIWGVLRGLETFSQLITKSDTKKLQISNANIVDKPRFPYRGLMLDTSRHFISINKIFQILDGMAYNKLNVFHWHMIDDQSFPYESLKYPELAKGAYHPLMTYTYNNVSNIIEYARMRGIRVIPEFDVPGHSASWGVSHPDLLTKCYGKYSGQLGPMNPIRKETFTFLKDFFSEIVTLFPDKNFHLGGDEVDEGCWESNQEIIDYVKENNIDFPDLGKEFVENMSNFLKTKEKDVMVWQEAIFDDIVLPKNTIVEVWFDWQSKMTEFTANGYKTLLTECWYLHVLDTGGDWEKFYNCDPHDFKGNQKQRNLVVGGEAAMWTEVVNDFNVIQRIFPRVCAAAERLWSPKNVKINNNVKSRLEEHVCRMILRGVESQPANDPGYC